VVVEVLNGAYTFVVMVQVPPAAIVPPEKLIRVPVFAKEPPTQVVASVPGTSVKGDGRESENAAPVYAKPVGFVRVMVKVLLLTFVTGVPGSLATIEVGEKVFPTLTALTIKYDVAAVVLLTS